MKNFKNKKVVLSGGSSGIGRAIIQQLFQEGVTQFAVIGRDPLKLNNLKIAFPDADFLLLEGDVSDLGNIRTFTEKIKVHWGTIVLLINSAGVVSAGPLETISDEDIIGQVNINVTGLILLTKHLLPLLKSVSESTIVNISSGLGLIGLPFYTTYAATKGAVRLFSEALRRELQHDFPIHVMTVYPTATDTAMMESAVAKEMDSAAWVAEKTVEGLKENKIDIILGGKQRLDDVSKNASDVKSFDENVFKMYEALKERTEHHRSM